MKEDQNKEELKRNLQRLANENPKREVSYLDLFSNQFMQKYTDFANFNFFMQNLKIKDFAQLEQLDQNELNLFVKNNSHFKSWEEMQQAAVNEYMSNLM